MLSTSRSSSEESHSTEGDGRHDPTSPLTGRIMHRNVLNPWVPCRKTNNGPAPCARFGHTATVVGNRMILVGGRNQQFYNDVWSMDMTMRTWTLEDRGTAAGAMPPRAGHTAVLFSPPHTAQQIVVYGGCLDQHTCVSDVWYLDIHTSQWRKAQFSSRAPTPRKGHTAVTDPEKGHMVVFGGSCGRRVDDDQKVWTFHMASETWQDLPTSGEQPSPRLYHVAEMSSRGKMIVFGGKTVGEYVFLNDLYTLDIQTGMWTAIHAVGTIPSGRMCSASVLRHNTLCIFVGGSWRCYDDCYEIDINAGEWRKLSCSSGLPPCTRPTTVLHQNRLTLFGGCDSESRFLDTTFELSLEAPSLKELCREWLKEVRGLEAVIERDVTAQLQQYLLEQD